MQRYKVLSTDNYARETVADCVLVENQGYDEARAICERLINERRSEYQHWYKIAKQEDHVWGGMEEFM